MRCSLQILIGSSLALGLLYLTQNVGAVQKHSEPSLDLNQTAPEGKTLAAIKALHDEDVAATLSGDPKRLANLFSEDGVLLEPGTRPQVGRDAILRENLKEKTSRPNAREISYTIKFSGSSYATDVVIEWGTFEAQYQADPHVPIRRFRGRILRVLKRQTDGSWRFFRVMWNPA